jgi:hypothetical protein
VRDGTVRRFLPGAALVGGLGTAVLAYDFGSRLLITNDDTRFPILARDALANGHWLVPALPDGRPHIVKPPLAAWLITLASWPSGHVSVRTAVLPSLLAAIGIVLLTYGLGRRLFGRDAGVVAGLIAATTVGMYTMAHSPMPDMVQLLAGTAAIAAYVASGFGASPGTLVLSSPTGPPASSGSFLSTAGSPAPRWPFPGGSRRPNPAESGDSSPSMC